MLMSEASRIFEATLIQLPPIAREITIGIEVALFISVIVCVYRLVVKPIRGRLKVKVEEEVMSKYLPIVIFLALMLPVKAYAQTAKTFVKVEPHQCWEDVKDYVHRRATGAVIDETYQTLAVERFASLDGDLSIIVAVAADHDKKGEAGCSIVVGIAGSSPYAQRANALNGGSSFRTALLIAGEVNSLQKARDKKAKDQKAKDEASH